MAYTPPPSQPGGTEGGSLFQWCRQAGGAIKDLFQGKMNVTGDLELTAGASTLLEDARLREGAIVVFEAQDAAAAVAAPWVSERAPGACTVSHTFGSEGRRVRYAIIG